MMQVQTWCGFGFYVGQKKWGCWPKKMGKAKKNGKKMGYMLTKRNRLAHRLLSPLHDAGAHETTLMLHIRDILGTY